MTLGERRVVLKFNPSHTSKVDGLIQIVRDFWLTCPIEVVRENWIPSQADCLLAYRVADAQAAA